MDHKDEPFAVIPICRRMVLGPFEISCIKYSWLTVGFGLCPWPASHTCLSTAAFLLRILKRTLQQWAHCWGFLEHAETSAMPRRFPSLILLRRRPFSFAFSFSNPWNIKGIKGQLPLLTEECSLYSIDSRYDPCSQQGKFPRKVARVFIYYFIHVSFQRVRRKKLPCSTLKTSAGIVAETVSVSQSCLWF